LIRASATWPVSLFDEMVIDECAGGGGASLGIERAIGRPCDLAVNHDPLAIAMHQANHPGTEHRCESIWDVDPVEATRGRDVGLAWFSPDCKHFSKAKGGKPVSRRVRGLAWIVIRWAKAVRPRIIMLLQPRELYRAQGFPDDYIIDPVNPETGRPLSKSDQVRMCGNSVCPVMAEALVRANVTSLQGVAA
jgi:DNA (cytosine-5)-methyltransferase 1